MIDSNTTILLDIDKPNPILENKLYILPKHVSNFEVVQVFLSNQQSVFIKSQWAPIRHGEHCGSQVRLSTTYGEIDYNPKFIWNGSEWLLNTTGTFIFAEIELNYNDK